MISKVGFFTTKEVYMEQNPVFPNGQNQRTFEPFRCKKVAIKVLSSQGSDLVDQKQPPSLK
jgi:hypothetical protein